MQLWTPKGLVQDAVALALSDYSETLPGPVIPNSPVTLAVPVMPSEPRMTLALTLLT